MLLITTPSDQASLPHSSPEVHALINRHAWTPQTSASLETITKTGRGELLREMNVIHGFSYVDPETGVNLAASESEATPLASSR
jgi:hypothetical protein